MTLHTSSRWFAVFILFVLLLTACAPVTPTLAERAAQTDLSSKSARHPASEIPRAREFNDTRFTKADDLLAAAGHIPGKTEIRILDATENRILYVLSESGVSRELWILDVSTKTAAFVAQHPEPYGYFDGRVFDSHAIYILQHGSGEDPDAKLFLYKNSKSTLLFDTAADASIDGIHFRPGVYHNNLALVQFGERPLHGTGIGYEVNHLYTVNANGMRNHIFSTPSNYFPEGFYGYIPSYSPDLSKIISTEYDTASGEFYTLYKDGGQSSRVTYDIQFDAQAFNIQLHWLGGRAFRFYELCAAPGIFYDALSAEGSVPYRYNTDWRDSAPLASNNNHILLRVFDENWVSHYFFFGTSTAFTVQPVPLEQCFSNHDSLFTARLGENAFLIYDSSSGEAVIFKP